MIVNGCKNKSLVKSFVYFPILPFGFVHRVKHIDKYFPTFTHAEKSRILCRSISNLFSEHWFYRKRTKWINDFISSHHCLKSAYSRYFRKIIIQSHSRNKAGARIKKLKHEIKPIEPLQLHSRTVSDTFISSTSSATVHYCRKHQLSTTYISQINFVSVHSPVSLKEIANCSRPQIRISEEEADEVRLTFHLFLSQKLYPIPNV